MSHPSDPAAGTLGQETFWSTPDAVAHGQLMLDSFARLLGYELVSREGTPLEQARRLFEAPRVVVSHGTQADPILSYGNRLALGLWEMDSETLMKTPSRLTAEPLHREARGVLLERTRRDGYVDDYSGIRISSTGRRFRIEQAIVWNLSDAAGSHRGQAATFDQWIPLPAGG